MANLDKVADHLKEQNKLLGPIKDGIETLVKDQARAREQARKDKIAEDKGDDGKSKGSKSSKGRIVGADAINSKEAGSKIGGMLKGILGGGMLTAVGGVAAMGLGISAFFGGLVAGDAGLSFMKDLGGDFSFSTLKDAAIGFSEMIMGMDPKSFVVLAGIMGVSAVGGIRGAKGLGAMGAAITAFLGGLILGNTLIAGAEALGADLKFDSLKKTLVGFGDMITGVSQEGLIALGGIMGLGVIATLASKDPTAVGRGMIAIGAGVLAFLGGLVLGNTLLTGVDALGADLNFPALKTAFAGFSESIGALSSEAAIALTGLLGAATGLAAFGMGPKKARDTAAIMTGLGAGISGFFIGLTAGDSAMDWIKKSAGGDGSAMVGAFKMFNDSVGELNNENAIKAMIAILGAGAGIGAIVGAVSPGMAAKAALGIVGIMTGIGAGISGLMIGLGVGDIALSWMQQVKGDGPGISGVFKTFNDSIIAITPEAIKRLESLKAIGGMDLVTILGGLSAGMAVFLGTSGIGGLVGTLKDGVLGTIDNIFGTETKASANKGIVQKMVDGLKPLDDFDTTKITLFTDSINGLTASFQKLGDLKPGSMNQLGTMLKGIGGFLSAYPYLMDGGTWRGQKLGLGDNINFGDGIKGMNSSELDVLAAGIEKLRNATGFSRIEATPAAQSISGGVNSESNNELITSIRDLVEKLDDVILGNVQISAAASMAGGAPMAAPLAVQTPDFGPR